MTERTAEQLKADFVARMGEQLGTQYSELRQELVRIYFKWSEFTALFAKDKKNIELFNSTAPFHFYTVQNTLWESSILHIARLTDPPKTGGQSNLTVQNLPALVTDEALKAEVRKLVEIATENSKFVREWRNKVFAHNDLLIALKDSATPVPTAEIKQVDAALKSIADVLNLIEFKYADSTTAFEFADAFQGAAMLIPVLEGGLKAKKEQLKRTWEEIEPASAPVRLPPNKPAKLRARRPRGLEDRGPADIAAARQMLERIRAVYERYGFEPVETPAIEYTDALGKFLPDQDRPNEGVFSFQDDDEQWLSLRYDLTAPLARYVAENFQHLALPYRSYRYGWVFRNEKPGPGRYRQFMQFDADTVGSASMAADAEMCMMAADTMEALGIPRGQYVVKVNNRKVLDGVMEAIGLGGEENAGKRLTVLRAIDKLDRLGIDGVMELLGKGRKDESGDFTRGADLDLHQALRIRQLVEIVPTANSSGGLLRLSKTETQSEDYLHWLKSNAELNPLASSGIDDLISISSIVKSSEYFEDRIRIDPSVVRGLEYYTGPVYEVELLLETKDEKGRPVRFGSVGGGGRYDGLVSRFRGQPVPATGFSIGVSRLQAALTLIGKLDAKPAPGPVLVTVFRDVETAHYQKLVAGLRNAGIRAELYLGSTNHNLGQQLRYADRRGSPCAVIQGGNEKAAGKVLVRDLIAGAELAKLEQSGDRDAYLKKQAEAQREVGEGDMLDAVRAVLARHGVNWS